MFEAEDLQKEHSSGPKYLRVRLSTGTGSKARIASRERDGYCMSALRKGVTALMNRCIVKALMHTVLSYHCIYNNRINIVVA